MLCICHSMRLICKSGSVGSKLCWCFPQMFYGSTSLQMMITQKVFCFIYQNIYLICGFKIISDLYNISASVFFLPWFWWTIPCLREFSTYPLWVLTTILRDYLNVLITKTFIGCVDLKLDLICLMLGYAFNLIHTSCYFGSVEDLKH